MAGFIPGYGDALDLINAFWYACEGNKEMAGLCLLSALPFIGSGLANVIRVSGKAWKYSKAVANLVEYGCKITSYGATFGRGLSSACDRVNRMYQTYKVEGKALDGNFYGELFGLGVDIATCVVSGMGLTYSTFKFASAANEIITPAINAMKSKIKGKFVNNGTIETVRMRLSDKVRKLMREGDYRQALDIHYEDLIRKKVGGQSKIIQGREFDVVTDTKLIQAKRSFSAINKPDNFLKGSTRKQIKETARIAKEMGLQPEYWFKYGVHPKVRKYIESKGIKVIIGLGD